MQEQTVPTGRVYFPATTGTLGRMEIVHEKPPHFVLEWRLHNKWSQEELAAKVGIGRAAISKIETGEKPLMQRRLRAFARGFGIEVRQLFEPPSHSLARTTQPAPNIAMIPAYDLQVPAGRGAWVDDDPEPVDLVPFRLNWIRSITPAPLTALGIVLVHGDSMNPLLFNGDMVMVDTTQKSPRDGVFVLRLMGELMVKRITIGPATVDISSDNKAHKSYDDVDESNLNIVGRVIWMGRRM